MKKMLSIIFLAVLVLFMVSCGGMSAKKYEEISTYVLENIDNLSSEKEIEFFDYEATGLCVGGTYYGYYWTVNNEVVVPDYYSDDNMGERYEADGGTYFGKPNDGTDWCFVKKITDKWYYYELHWG